VTDRWTLPKSPWHLDHPFVQGKKVSGVNMFLFVDVKGSVAKAGAHALRSGGPDLQLQRLNYRMS